MMETVTLIASVLAAIFAALSYCHSLKSEKAQLKRELKSKEAEFTHINSMYFDGIFASIGSPEKSQMEVRKRILEDEIKELKREIGG